MNQINPMFSFASAKQNETVGTRGLYRRSGISPCPEDFYKYTTKSYLVNAFGKNYNSFMRSISSQIHDLLIKAQKTVSVAESCTGGLVSQLLTEKSGSSSYFLLGITAYSNQAKQRILNIPKKLISSKGAVSYEVALMMAKQVRALSKSDFGIGVTGIAGPTGRVPHKPVGTVFIAVSGPTKNICERFLFTGNRTLIRKKAAIKALEMLNQLLSKN